MATAGGIAAGLLGSAASEAAAFAAGLAIGPTLAPEIEFLKNEAWNAAQTRALEPGVAAEVAAEDVDQYAAMAQQAAYHGIAGALFKDLYGVTLNAPGTGELLAMLRRGTINPGNFTHGLRKAKLEPMWDAGLADLQHQYIGLGDIALAIVRGAVPTPSWVPVGPPTTGTTIPRFPVVNIDPAALAGKLGYSEDMLRIMTARSGLSLAPGLAAQAFFRGIITRADAHLAAAEGDLRTEWSDTLIAVSRSIPTPGNFVQGHLRGWRTQQEMYDGAALHGMANGHTDLLYQIERRPLNPHAITTALARGGQFRPQAGEIADPYEASVHQADLGPEWYDLAIANKYTYPSAFVLRSLAEAGDLGGQAEVEQVLLEIGWRPFFAAKVSKAWTTGTATGDPHVTKAHNTAWTKAQASYIARESTAADVQPIFTLLGIPAGAQTEITQTWNAIRALVRAQLTPAQIKKALREGITNPATGQAWTMQEAIDALLARGYDHADATVLLEE